MRTRPPLVALSIALLLAMSLGCKKKKNQAPPEEKGSIFRDVQSSGPADPRYGSQGQITVERATNAGVDPANEAEGTRSGEKVSRTYKNCRKARPVTRGDLKTPEGTLWHVFEALLIADDDAAFEAFYALIDPEYKNERDARRYWFKQARLVKKDGIRPFRRLVYSDKDPSFDVCEIRPEGKDTKRIFVGKSPPVGSNPPFVLHKVGEKWLIKNFTPF